ncbi:hypothetical protein T09_5672, partial [Trichinella sp. T9]
LLINLATCTWMICDNRIKSYAAPFYGKTPCNYRKRLHCSGSGKRNHQKLCTAHFEIELTEKYLHCYCFLYCRLYCWILCPTELLFVSENAVLSTLQMDKEQQNLFLNSISHLQTKRMHTFHTAVQ